MDCSAWDRHTSSTAPTLQWDTEVSTQVDYKEAVFELLDQTPHSMGKSIIMIMIIHIEFFGFSSCPCIPHVYLRSSIVLLAHIRPPFHSCLQHIISSITIQHSPEESQLRPLFRTCHGLQWVARNRERRIVRTVFCNSRPKSSDPKGLKL